MSQPFWLMIFRTRSRTNVTFCLYRRSLLRSMWLRRARDFLIWSGALSRGVKRRNTGITGLLNVSAKVRSFLQLSLCRYFGVIQQMTTDADFILRCIWLWRDSAGGSKWVTLLRLLLLLWPRGGCATISDQQGMPLFSRRCRISSTFPCMSHW